MGYAILADEIKDNSKEMVELLHKEKVEIILLTGDKEENAKEIS
jgi:P-type E1-E2 ATPase